MRPDDKDDNRSTIQEIGEVYAAEKASIKITRLPDEFYEKANSLIEGIRARIENFKATTKEELSEEYYDLAEEYKRQKDILNSIYNMRERKIVLMAMNSARKITHSTENMVHDEENLFFDLKMEMEKIRGRILRFGARSQEPLRAETGLNIPLADYEDPEPEPLSPFRDRNLYKQRPPPKEKPEIKKEEVNELLAPPLKKRSKDDLPEGMIAVKALRDIATFICPDKTPITMKKEDVAVLPKEIVNILVMNGSVEPIGGTR
ncbi:MAG: DNA replication complex GINS family protein [Candidatus Thermoplasmatota archaeon]|nr:DNA replication complex GINS family protein [Candidatus Thermoplasmatota archaeon]